MFACRPAGASSETTCVICMTNIGEDGSKVDTVEFLVPKHMRKRILLRLMLHKLFPCRQWLSCLASTAFTSIVSRNGFSSTA